MSIEKCKWCRMPKRIPGTGKEVDHSDCREKAKDPKNSLPDPECEHENEESIGGISGTQNYGGRIQDVSLTAYQCQDCGGVRYR